MLAAARSRAGAGVGDHRAHARITSHGGAANPAADEAAARYHLAIAREQEARSFELRAGTSLAHLWCDQGKRADARDLLAPIYGWFTEGFDTRDLIEAKALLEELPS